VRFSLHIEAGGLWHKVGPVRLPDGLHVWVGNRGVHLFWKRGALNRRRVVFDRMGSVEL
jgi:hypothetical protein